MPPRGKRKGKSRRNRQKRRNGTRRIDPMTATRIDQVKDWLHRMESNLSKAIALSDKLQGDALDDGDDNFWALVKYAENVQECAVQLDNMDRSILEALEEVPITSEGGDDLNWDGLKGMRVHLAHKFWNIDSQMLWETATRDFPVLRNLLGLLIVADPSEVPGAVAFSFRARKFRLLPVSEPGDASTLGNSLIMMFFDDEGRARCLRAAKLSETRVVFKAPDDVIVSELSLSLFDGAEREHLGRWPSRPAG